MSPSASPARAVSLRCENLTDPLGLDERHPRFSWWMLDRRFGARQTGYEIEVLEAAPRAAPRLIWKDDRTTSDSVLIEYRGPALQPHCDYRWRVRLRDREGARTPWSDDARWSTGLLGETWSAAWIGLRQVDPAKSTPVRFLRTEIELPSAPVAARWYVTALGLFEAQLNGGKVSNDVLVPGWTDYRRRVDYLVYDVTDRLHQGANVLAALLADGWYSGRLTWHGQRRLYGKVPAFSSLLRVAFADGSVRTFPSDTTWRVATGAFESADLYDGETLDRRREPVGWSTPGFDARGWKRAERIAVPSLEIKAKPMPPVRPVETVKARQISEPQPGRFIFDYGQNLVGVPRLTVNEASGTVITLRFGEMLKPDGTLYTANLRSARATDVYTCRGDRDEVFEPRFTFHGFRYAEISGGTRPPERDTLVAVVQQTDLPATGRFSCSEARLNRLQENIRWGQRSNYLEAPTDCPQRDERLGWTGDAQVFIGTAAFNYDVSTFFSKWLRDLRDGQRANGSFPDVAPDCLPLATEQDPTRWAPHQWDGNAAWADAGVICPWVVYRRYGDTRVLRENFTAMKAWIAHQRRTSRSLIRPATEYGDWLATDAVTPDRAPTPCDLVGTAYFAASTDLAARTARVLGESKEAKALAALHRRIMAAFQREFVSPTGRVVGDTQTGYLLALAFDLLPARQRPGAVSRLVQLIEGHRNRLATGFVGTPLLCPVLSRFGREDVAFRLLLQQEYPSWLYPVINGATTMWERWNSWTEKSGFGDVGMNSFNHYAYGAVGEWMYGAIGGIQPEPVTPGFEHFRLQPMPSRAIRSGSAQYDSPRGRIVSSWKLTRGRWTWDVVIPANTRATAIIPALRPQDVVVTPRGEKLSLRARSSPGVVFDLEAGQYRILVKNPRLVPTP